MSALLDRQAFFDDFVPRWILDTEERSIRLEAIFRAHEIPLAGPILDVGGGAGILLPLLRSHAERETLIVELEISREMLRMGKQLHGDLPRISYIQADGHVLPFPDDYFGSVHCFSAFPHFHERGKVLREFHRCMRPGGRLCILHLMAHEELNALHRDAGRVVAEDHLPPVEVLAGIVGEAGFDVDLAIERSDLYLLTAGLRKT